jgi:hypothetical protein
MMGNFDQNRHSVQLNLRVKQEVREKLDSLAEEFGYTPEGRGVSGLVSDLVCGPKANPEHALSEAAIIGNDVGRAMRALSKRIEAQGDCDDCRALLAELQATRRDIAMTLKQAVPVYENRVLSPQGSHDDWSASNRRR